MVYELVSGEGCIFFHDDGKGVGTDLFMRFLGNSGQELIETCKFIDHGEQVSSSCFDYLVIDIQASQTDGGLDLIHFGGISDSFEDESYVFSMFEPFRAVAGRGVYDTDTAFTTSSVASQGTEDLGKVIAGCSYDTAFDRGDDMCQV